MCKECEIRQIFTSVASAAAEVERLLADAGLRPEPLPFLVGAFDDSDGLMAVGGLDGNVIKCVAVKAEARGGAVANSIISALLSRAYEDGHANVFVFTKPEYESLFADMSFTLVGRCADAVLLENDSRGVRRYADYLRGLPKGDRNGVIVMNCNPLTSGHLYLIKAAAKSVDRMFVIPVKEDRSLFSYAERREMLERAARQCENVTICDGSPYTISAATFPTYFLKELSSAAETQMALDCDIFNRHIAPALNASVRFVGSEPDDRLTALYNDNMAKHLDIEVEVIERLTGTDRAPVSASNLRRALLDGRAGDALGMAPLLTAPFILAHAATQALTQELELTPKPGLVDLHDNGSHTDMDPGLMRRSIAALHPWFVRLGCCDVNELQALGLEAEKDMFEATKGVNTHRGALFCMGLTVAAAARLAPVIDETELHGEIKRLAARFVQPEGTHGHAVKMRYGLPGALVEARGGYARLFNSWLPFYRSVRRSPHARYLLLMKIMSEIEDTNVYHRCGKDGAARVKEDAHRLLTDFSVDALRELNGAYVKENISPGGAADMLALTLLIDSITHKSINP